MSGNLASARKRAAAYLKKMGPAIQGQGGDNHTYKVACALVRDFALPEADALDLMRAWNETCLPPWKEGDIVAKLRGAARYGCHAVGAKLDEARPRLRVFDTAREALGALLHALYDNAPPDVIGWLLTELADTARWARWSKSGPDPASIPAAHRKAALLAAVGAYIEAVAADRDAEPGAEPVAPPDGDAVQWIMEQAAREHFACLPSAKAKRDEALYANDSIDAMQTWTRTKTGVRHTPRAHDAHKLCVSAVVVVSRASPPLRSLRGAERAASLRDGAQRRRVEVGHVLSLPVGEHDRFDARRDVQRQVRRPDAAVVADADLRPLPSASSIFGVSSCWTGTGATDRNQRPGPVWG